MTRSRASPNFRWGLIVALDGLAVSVLAVLLATYLDREWVVTEGDG